MPNYQNGKIYKITSPSTDKIYIGSTIQPLHRRFDGHKSHYKTGARAQSSNKMLQYNDCVITLIEEYPCNSKKELCEREQYYMNFYKEILVNSHNSTFDKKEYRKTYEKHYKSNPENVEKIRVYKQNYRKKNIEYIKKRDKKYNEANKERISIKSSEYYFKNKEKHNEKCRIYNEKNREYLNEKQRLRMKYQNSWGGDKRSNNNLLEIDIDLFN